MKTIHFLPAILLFLFLGSAIAQTGEGNQRALNAVINSEILDEDRDFVIYLPDDYYTSENQYPVLYILTFQQTANPLSMKAVNMKSHSNSGWHAVCFFYT